MVNVECGKRIAALFRIHNSAFSIRSLEPAV